MNPDTSTEATPEDLALAFAEEAKAILGNAAVEKISLSKLSVDPNVQRVLYHPRAKRIASRYNPQAFGLPAVSKRDDGTNVIIDGMHRIAALRMVPANIRGGEDPMVACETWEGLTIGEEAQIFVLRNDTEKVPALALFLVRVHGGDPGAIAVRDMLSTYGWTVRGDRKNGSVNAIHTVENCFIANQWATNVAVETITTAWPSRPAIAMERHMIRAVMAIFAKYKGEVDTRKLISRLSKAIPDALITSGKYHSTLTRGVTVTKGIAYVILDDYNKAPGVKKLAPRI